MSRPDIKLDTKLIGELVGEGVAGGGRIRLEVATDSMRPLINPKDKIVVRGGGIDDLTRGDILLFLRDGNLLAHRLLFKQKGGDEIGLVTKADNAFIADEPISCRQLLGRIITIEKGSRTINLEARRWKILNRLLGELSLLEWSAFKVARWLKRIILGNYKRDKGVDFSSEDRLILLCSRIVMESGSQAEAREVLGRDLDWNYTLKRGRGEGISALLYHGLKKMGKKRMPQEISGELEKDYYNNLARNFLIYRSLGQILRVLEKDRVEVIVLKGAALADVCYSNIALRPMTDIDILIHKKDLPKAKGVLQEIGYRLEEPDYGVVLEKFASDLKFVKEGEIGLEVHWVLTQYERFKGIIEFDMEGIWQTAESCRIDGVQCKILSFEHLILYLCTHLSLVHFFTRLIWFCDIAEVIRYYRGRIDWEYILTRAGEYKLKTILYYTLYLTKELLDCPISDEVLAKLRPGKIRMGLLRLCIKGNGIKGLRNTWLGSKRHIGHILMMDEVKDRFRLLFRFFCPSREWLIYRYHLVRPNKIFLYHLLYLKLTDAKVKFLRR